MTVFFDTSSLFKLYHREEGSEELMAFFRTNRITELQLAEIAEVEFASVVWKKCRVGELRPDTADFLLERFKTDCERYSFVRQGKNLRSLANDIMQKYWHKGLRVLDSIQLASVMTTGLDRFLCSDRILREIDAAEGITVI